MKTSRRIPRKIEREEDDESFQFGEFPQAASEPEHVVKKPAQTVRRGFGPKKSSKVRVSLRPGTDEGLDDSLLSEANHGVRTGTNVSSTKALFPQSTFPHAARTDERPRYSSEYLEELKRSTPSYSQEKASDRVDESTSIPSQDLDIVSKFGETPLHLSAPKAQPNPQIPSETEIREKKERRRRLAKEQEYIPLDNHDSDGDRSSRAAESDHGGLQKASLIIPMQDSDLLPKHPETRLTQDDDDVAEGFEDFVEDPGKVALNRRAAREQDALRRKELQAQIHSAQHGYGYGISHYNEDEEEEDAVDEEDVARNVAYEASQTRAGTYGLRNARMSDLSKEEKFRRKLEIPRSLKTVPEWKDVMGKFQELLSAKERELASQRKRLEQVDNQRGDIIEEEIRIKELLTEAGEKYERLQADAGKPLVEVPNGSEVAGPLERRAAESSSIGISNLSIENEESEQPASTILSPQDRLAGEAGSSLIPGMAGIPKDEDDYSDEENY